MTQTSASVQASGLLVVDKPKGLTSHSVVSQVRRLAGTKKVGHAGTLDPMATGVLIVGINRATRLLGHLALADKSYAATIRLGVTTTTDDADGEVDQMFDTSSLEESVVERALVALRGDLEQVPSSVSAIKVDGQRAYARVRAGESVTLQARPVHVARFELRALTRAAGVVDVDVEVDCSTGTYVRALARDLGVALGVGGHLTSLRRTAIGQVGIEEASTLDHLWADYEEGRPLQPVSMAQTVRRFFTCLDLTADQADDVRVGRRLNLQLATALKPVALLDPAGSFLALYAQAGDVAKPVAVFV